MTALKTPPPFSTTKRLLSQIKRHLWNSSAAAAVSRAARANHTMQRSCSAAGTLVSTTPTRELSFRNGTFVNNIIRLEQTAERMSENGSDIGEEIRRLNDADKAARSRQNSIQSSHQGDVIPGRTVPLEATWSTSSHTHSIVDVNGAARQGGYSPAGYITSPAGSFRSRESWSRHPSTHRKPSVGSRLATEYTQGGQFLASPVATEFVSHRPANMVSRQDSQASQASRASASSFAKRYDQIAGQIEQHLETVPPTPLDHDSPRFDFDFDGDREAEQALEDGLQLGRPRSDNTYREAQDAFEDFDGVHYSPERQDFLQYDDEGNEVRRMSARKPSNNNLSDRPASMLRTTQPRPISYAVPPPNEGMVYYPAPVPRMLNLPKRLSQLPSAIVQAKRRSQVLSQMPTGARNSAAWLSQTSFDNHEQVGADSSSQGDTARAPLNERMSMMNFQNMPPQLRASVFFEHQSQPQDVAIMSESAVATLDNILAASVTAPVNAFTDHPFAGDVRKTVYAPERTARRSTAALIQKAANAPMPEPERMKRRSSLGMLLRRTSSGNELGAVLAGRESRTSTLLDFSEGGVRLKKRKSQMSLAGELERPESIPLPPTPGEELDFEDGLLGHGRPATAMSGRARSTVSGDLLKDGERIDQDFAEQEEAEDAWDPDAGFVQPSTLLAELQVRKAQQKSRNRTAVTAFPNGMHSTLLQLDAVADIEKRKRQMTRIALAWEDPSTQEQAAHQAEEDDVPLGILFPSKNGLANRAMGDERDWDRPLGLMEKRQLEDSEPLSSRRNRLLGGPALSLSRTRDPGRPGAVSQMSFAAQPEDDGEGETLAQRLRRLRTKQELDVAISDIAPKDGERPVSTFSMDVLSQFDGLGANDKAAAVAADAGLKSTATPADETLGQRRARLQREAEAKGGTRNASDPAATGATDKRPALYSSNSMANLLSAHPVGATRRATTRGEPARGSLLASSAQYQAHAKRQLHDTNMRSSSYGLDRSLIERQRAANPLPGMQTPHVPVQNFYASPSAMHVSGLPYPYAQQQQQLYQPQMNPLAYNSLVGMPAMNYPYAMHPGMGMPMGMPFGMTEEQMSPQQRANIDHWRQSVAPH